MLGYEDITTPTPTPTPVVTPAPTSRPSSGTTPTPAPTATPTVALTTAPSAIPAPTAQPTEEPVEMPKEADTTIAEVVVKEEAVKAVKETVTVAEAEKDVVIQLTDATIKLDAKAVQAITEQANGETIEIRVVQAETTSLTSAQQKKIKDMDTAVVVSAQIFSDGEYIGKFKGGKATVMLPFEVEDGKAAEDYKVYYIDEKGDLKKVAAEYVNGHMVFTTAHLSEYVIVYEGTQADIGTETLVPEEPAAEGTFPIIPIAIVIAMVVIGVVVVLTKKKNTEE